VGIFFLLSIPFLLVTRILHAYQRQYFAHGMHFVSYLLTLLSLIIGVHYRYDFLQLLVAIHLIPLVWQMLCWYLVARKIPWAGFARKSVRVSALKRIAQSSVPLLVLQLINVLASQIIPILLAAVTTLKEVADFTILWKIFLFIFFTMSNIASAYLPGIRDAFERGEMAWIKRAIKYLLLLQMGIIAVGCLPLLFAGNEIITVWIRMPLEKPLANGEWLLYSCCILFGVLNSTLNAILLILDKIALQIVLALVSNALVIASIAWGVSHRGLIVIFTVMALTALISLYYSFRQLKRDILA
jgi:O-antigen/teichoic acid export membrane protein